MQEVRIRTPYIRLGDALKFSGAAATGGHAKAEIEEGRVRVNGEVCAMRGKKLRSGDVFTFEGVTRRIVWEADAPEDGPDA